MSAALGGLLLLIGIILIFSVDIAVWGSRKLFRKKGIEKAIKITFRIVGFILLFAGLALFLMR